MKVFLSNQIEKIHRNSFFDSILSIFDIGGLSCPSISFEDLYKEGWEADREALESDWKACGWGCGPYNYQIPLSEESKEGNNSD